MSIHAYHIVDLYSRTWSPSLLVDLLATPVCHSFSGVAERLRHTYVRTYARGIT